MPRKMVDILGNPKFRLDDRYRLEPLPRSNEVASGLTARVHDPAWALTRQWQFGEFAGQDAGSPVLVELSGHSTAISAWRPAGRTGELAVDRSWVPYDPKSGPLDGMVESEDIAAPDELTRIEGGAHFLRMLDEKGLRARTPDVLAAYGFEHPPTGPSNLVTILAPKVPDAERLVADFTDGAPGVAGLGSVPADWLTWWRGLFPAEAPDTFDPHRFEHRVDMSFGDKVFHSEEYLGDGLDWFTVDLDPTATPAPTTPAAVHMFTREAIPSTVRYGGIPADRFWEMEDAQIDLGSTDVEKLDTGRLLLIAFAEVYGNDRFLLPLEVPAGSLTVLDKLVVSDSFGGKHEITRAGTENEGWNLFTVTGTDDGLLVMPSERGAVGEPLETVALLRDELANLAWAVEKSFTDLQGDRVDRRERWLRIAPESPPPRDIGSYAVQTIVPDYWLPLVPHAVTLDQIRFALVPLQQPGFTSEPHGRLLHTDDWVHEEEVPRDGALVTRRPVLARWFDGSWHSWVRRQKNPGSGEGSSGLHFDIVRPSEPWP
ncbi:hypothetical protein [Nocardia sp. NBC_01009]|uniref:hypothetical protein n=1 Tax=Nocardia sp. NBC_01009 TaxID=2975996 RepID=UPI00386E2D1C|nr:hypothetical protein OHA42_20015 [Nocardia sp. NBC_01009]